MWREVKREVADKNVAQDPKEIERIAEEAFASVTTFTKEDWTDSSVQACGGLIFEKWLPYGWRNGPNDISTAGAGDSETASDSVSMNSSDSDVSMIADDHN